MTELSDLARRIQSLEDITAITQLKFRYWDSVDGKRWADLEDCLAEGFVFQGPHLGRIEGKAIFPRMLQRIMRGAVTVHQGHNPLIQITGTATARGRWALNDRVESPDGGYFRGHGHYDDEYVKQEGVWRILSTNLNYTFTEQSS